MSATISMYRRRSAALDGASPFQKILCGCNSRALVLAGYACLVSFVTPSRGDAACWLGLDRACSLLVEWIDVDEDEAATVICELARVGLVTYCLNTNDCYVFI